MSRLKPPPSSPNCVSSLADPSDKEHAIAPFSADQWSKVKEVMATLPRCVCVSSDDHYAHYEVKTRFFGFVDDVEFELDGDRLHVRSASRVGYGDLGVNRRRVESIRALAR